MAITAHSIHQQSNLELDISRILDEQQRDLTRAWVDAYDEVSGELERTVQQMIEDDKDLGVVSKSTAVKSSRLISILAYMEQQLTTLARDAGVRIMADVRGVVASSVAAQERIIGAQLPPRFPLPGTVPAEAIDAIVGRTAQQITSLAIPLAPDAYAAMRAELLRGFVIGANPNQTAHRIMRRVETRFNGGLARAINVSRTETIDAYRSVAQVGQLAHADVLVGWTWLAHLSPRTCRSCIAMNGTVHPLTEPGPLDHQQGRCSRMPTTKSWADLGIRSREPASTQIPSSAEWFARLNTAQQRDILGDDGYTAWRAGRFPISDWARRQNNSGWRDSYVPAAPPKEVQLVTS